MTGSQTYRIALCGDFCNRDSKNRSPFGQTLKNVLSSCDLRIINLETPITDSLEPIAKSGPSIKIDPEQARVIKQVEPSIVTLGNNHIMDYGLAGLAGTLNWLRTERIAACGAGNTIDEAYAPIIQELSNGLKIGVVSLCEKEFGIAESGNAGTAWIGHPNVHALLMETRRATDILILVVHGGVEMFSLPSYQMRRRLYHLVEAYRPDCIACHHPHVIQGFEVFRTCPIFYSLGDFYWPYISNGLAREKRIGMSIVLTISDRKLSGFEIIPTFLGGDLSVDVLSELCRNDFDCYIKALNDALAFDNYNSLWRYSARFLFNDRYRPVLFGAGIKKMQWRHLIKYLVQPLAMRFGNTMSMLLRMRKNHELFLLNCIQNESHREIIAEAMGGNRLTEYEEACSRSVINEISTRFAALFDKALRLSR